MTALPRRTPLTLALRGRGLGARLMAGFVLAFQFFLVGAVPVLDARADHATQVVVHVEDAQQNDCPASHDASDCQLCQVLSSTRALPVAVIEGVGPRVERVAALPATVQQGAPALVFLSGNASRAPPRV